MAEDIFSDWKERSLHKNKLFITDGIIDYHRWNKSHVKILFLLKEAYESDKQVTTGWDLCSWIREKKGLPKNSKMWKAVAQWAYGIQNLAKSKERDAPRFPRVSEKKLELDEALLSSAVINLKKSGGNSNSKDEDLQRYVDEDWELIHQQIMQISPDIIICGYTWHLIEKKLTNINTIDEWVYEAEGLRFVNFWHPANHYPYEMNYYTLCSVVRMAQVLP